MKSGRKSPRGHATNMSMANMTAVDGRGNTPERLSGIPSASVTATTIFPGLGGNSRADESGHIN